MQLPPAMQQIVDDAVEDLGDAIEMFKMKPSAETLDDVYRVTTAIETACRNQLK